ncbi:MAG: hypothetical protein KDD62_08520 [Bdellovibrionales bacterium]|nr:hypothetical protein [Bdellovibrionales bacterium]
MYIDFLRRIGVEEGGGMPDPIDQSNEVLPRVLPQELANRLKEGGFFVEIPLEPEDKSDQA